MKGNLGEEGAGGYIMNSYLRKLLGVVSVAALVLGAASQSVASDNSTVVLPAEGNVRCNDYAANDVILSMDTSSPTASGTVQGPDDPADADSDPESATYAISGGTTLSFSNSSRPVDFAVLKSSREVAVIMYEAGGVSFDGNMTITRSGVDLPIDAFSLCYGLSASASPRTTPVCDDVYGAGYCAATAPGGERKLIYAFDLDADGGEFYNTEACVCNSAPLEECNPSVAAGNEGACPHKDSANPAPEVTTHIELNNDPYYCETIGGERNCYWYPFYY